MHTVSGFLTCTHRGRLARWLHRKPSSFRNYTAQRDKSNPIGKRLRQGSCGEDANGECLACVEKKSGLKVRHVHTHRPPGCCARQYPAGRKSKGKRGGKGTPLPARYRATASHAWPPGLRYLTCMFVHSQAPRRSGDRHIHHHLGLRQQMRVAAGKIGRRTR